MQAPLMHPSADMPQPQYRPLSVARHLPCCRCFARHQEKLHRVRGSLRPLAARYRRCTHQPHQPPIHRRTDYQACKRKAESCPRTHIRPGAQSHAKTFLPALLRLQEASDRQEVRRQGSSSPGDERRPRRRRLAGRDRASLRPGHPGDDGADRRVRHFVRRGRRRLR